MYTFCIQYIKDVTIHYCMVQYKRQCTGFTTQQYEDILNTIFNNEREI